MKPYLRLSPTEYAQRKARAQELLRAGHARRAVCESFSPPIAYRTLTEWMRDPSFRAAAQPTEETVAEPDAVRTLRALLNSDSETVRLSAARALLLSSAGEADSEDDDE